jgi:uncharacterized protein YbaP (TraB family)
LFGAGAAIARPVLWIAHGRHATVYLFGSIHLLPKDLDWAPPDLLAALPKASEIWFELPIDQNTDVEAARLSLALGYLPAGDSLSRHLTGEQARRLRRVAGLEGVSADALERLRPWLAEVTLSLLDDQRAGAAAGRGVEQQLEAMAPATARRRAFETPRQQIQFLAGSSMEDQVASLNETLTEIEDQPDMYSRVVSGWMAGDLRELIADALDPLRTVSPTLYRRLISERNARWTRTIEARLHGRGTAVVVVGAGHLIGPDGVPARLRAAGIAVDGP